MNKSLRLFLKKCYLWLNNKTIKSRFFFDGEYARWKKFNEKRVTIDNSIDRKMGKEQKIYYLVPGVAISGGIAVIFQHVNGLLKKGYDVKILSLNNNNDANWFSDQKVEILPYRQTKKILKSGEIDVLIATAYSTAFTVDMANARRKFYFVQSDERKFFPEDENLIEKIKKTYELTLEYLTMANWIQEWLQEDFGKDAKYVPNGLDIDVFRKTESIEEKGEKIRVLIEGAINVSLKGMDDAYLASKDLDCELWIVSNNGKPKNGWKYDKFFENVPFGKMAEIYSSCDILLKMSKVESFCYPPLEMMACGGVSVIRKVNGIEEYAINNENCLIVDSVEDAKRAIQGLMANSDLRNKLINSGSETVKNWGWENSIDALEEIVK